MITLHFYANIMKEKALLLLFSLYTTCLAAQTPLDPLSQSQFVNPLPIPAVIDARSGGTFTINISQFEQNLGLVNPITRQPIKTKVWGYNHTYPGPTILARKGVAINIFWKNGLVDASNKPLPHLLPVDVTIDWAFSGTNNWQQYGVPIVTHLHGGHTESASDGLPDAWYTPNFTAKGPGFIKGDIVPYTYSNTQEAATLWYHDHALGITRLNAYAGLAGFYVITDDNETNLRTTGKLPASPYDIGLALQDKTFTTDGQLFYPSQSDIDDPIPSVLPESFGNIILVNGMAWPVLNVEPRQYRFRILNASDSRFYNLFLSSGQPFIQIASDDGLLTSPVVLSDVLIAPGERREVILDFSNPALWGQTIVVRNIAKMPYPRGSTVNPNTTGKIMAFRVNKPLNKAYPLTTLPAALRSPVARLTTKLSPRKLILFESTDEFGRLKPMLGTFESGVLDYNRPVTEKLALNSTETWEIYNETVDAHPIHLHQVSMQLVNRQKFSATIDPITGKPSQLKLHGIAKPPLAEEAGWKDTYVMYPGEVTRVIARFDLAGRYVWHCHILSHEDHEMMRPFVVGPIESSMREDLTELSAGSANKTTVKTIPNPFSSLLTLQLSLNKSSYVVVDLYDAKGTLIQKLYQGLLSIGIHQFTIDGSKLLNGTYVCDILVNNERIVRKVILQK